MWNIIKRLNRERYEPHIALLKDGGALADEVRAAGVPLHILPFTVAPRPLWNLGARLAGSARKIRPLSFTLWHSFHYSDDYTEGLIAALCGARWLYSKKNMFWGTNAWRIRTELAWGIPAQNPAMLEECFSSRWLRRKVMVVERGVDTDKYQPGGTPRLGLRARLGIAADVPVIGCVAILSARKGHPTIIRALAQVPRAHLLCAGPVIEPDYAAGLVTLARELGVADRVHFLGNVEDVAGLLAELDVFVFPTRSEGTGVALLEAMACGVASVGSAAPGPADVIVDGVSGLTCPVDEPEPWARALTRLVEAPALRLKLGAAGRQRIVDQYSIWREVREHEALYERVLAAPPLRFA